MNHKRSVGEVTFDVSNVIILALTTIITIYPFWYIFIYSVSDPAAAAGGKVIFFPAGFTLDNYRVLLSQTTIFHAAFISSARTVIGTITGTFSCALFAYVLTKELLPFRKAIYRIIVFTMYVTPGLIPWYIVMKGLGLKNNFLLYILPSLITGFYLILIKTYIESLPAALEESALVDGAGYLTIFLKIIFPLTKPVIATVAIFIAVGQWNTWQDNMFLAPDKSLETLQLLLYRFLSTQEASMTSIRSTINNVRNSVTPASVRMTITVIVTLPIILVYPFMQRFFIKGIMLGAVKG